MFEQYRTDMSSGYFGTIIEQCEKILAKDETKPPADIALYFLGEVYARPNFSGMDYGQSQYYFEKLIQNFPDSPLAAEAKTFVNLYKIIAVKEKVALTAKKKKAAVAAQKEKSPPRVIVVEKKVESPSPPLQEPREIVKNKDFESATQKYLQVVNELGNNKPADEALYNLGLIYAHVDNPSKDYKKSKYYFTELIDKFPDSQYAEEARIWLGLFETLEKIQQIDIEIEQQKKQNTSP
jgi:outer membrane protein assembly factor BamD (BamD/ComL family)